MQIIHLPIFWTILIDIGAWAFFHIGISLFMAMIPVHFFEKENSLYKLRKWEKSGELWERLFSVRLWKHLIPDGKKVIRKGFEKNTLASNDKRYLKLFVIETKRAELTHWVSILPAGLFFLWNPAWAGWIMVAYAFLFNLPIIIVQRYNRPRIERFLSRKRKTRVTKEAVLK